MRAQMEQQQEVTARMQEGRDGVQQLVGKDANHHMKWWLIWKVPNQEF